MATYGQRLRQGLPRTPGGEAWPAEGDAPIEVRDAAPAVAEPQSSSVPASPAPEPSAPVEAAVTGIPEVQAPAATGPEASAPVAASAAAGVRLRRGLPRTPGGEPWPPASVVGAAVPQTQDAAASAPAPSVPVEAAVAAAPEVQAPAATGPAPSAPTVVAEDGPALRRGLPRTPGGEPWPPAGTVARRVVEVAAPAAPAVAEALPAEAAPAASLPAASVPAASTAVETASGPREPLPFRAGVIPGRFAFTRVAPKPEPEKVGPLTQGQWAGLVIVGGAGLVFAAAMAVFLVRWLLSFGPLQDFIVTFPGEYHLPEGAPVGFPAWLGWQHFFNVFLMLLIIRSGWKVRTDQRPSAFWTGKGKNSKKISLNLWFHQSLDILWLLNGVIFVVLLFVSGQWMRVIPTSWEVFPNALSAGLQYVSLDWPTENGWVNYNSLQQLAYFTTIFIAAPLAAVTGYRMSELWPKNAKALNRIYPVEWARAVHFPVMLYFVVFIVIHVALVFSTGALRNLNHMYAAQGSVDGVAYADNWTGFWMFVLSLAVIVAAWIAARPLVLAPIAGLFGKVSNR